MKSSTNNISRGEKNKSKNEGGNIINITENKERIKLKDLSMPFMCYDLVMKAIFTNEVNILAKMISDITGIDYEILENNIILETNEMLVNNLKEKAKRCGFILKISKDHNLNLEVKASYYPGYIINVR